ncbi:MAG: DHH family phosphoesterase [Prevotellaceae bacterium]|jgi:phosphoesterase RecJ-like protein|nr:DHH family phosphoesterase [Prevotellaceae bacterium]
MITKIIPEEKVMHAKHLMNNAENIVIVSHKSPDGDAVGSAMAMYHFLFSIDKNVSVVLPDRFPDFLSWMQCSEEVVFYNENKARADELFAAADLIFALDFNTLPRIGDMAEAVDEAKADKILLDHHPQPGHFAQLIISHPEISSTSEIVFRLITRMGHFPDINIPCAEAIYTGMMTDTGAFTYNSDSPEIYVIISRLLNIGIEKDRIYNNVYNNHSADRFRLMGFALSERMRVYPEHRAALITLTMEEKKRFNYKKGDAEGFVNIPLSIKGIVFSAFFREEEDKIRISLRSQNDSGFPTNKVCQTYYNGGGHLNASGGELKMSMEEAIAHFENTVLAEYESELKS